MLNNSSCQIPPSTSPTVGFVALKNRGKVCQSKTPMSMIINGAIVQLTLGILVNNNFKVFISHLLRKAPKPKSLERQSVRKSVTFCATPK